MKSIVTDKEIAKKKYIEAKNAYLKNMTDENWKSFCNAKVICMHLGVRI